MRNALIIAALTVALPAAFFVLVAIGAELASPDGMGMRILVGAVVGAVVGPPVGFIARALLRALKGPGDLQ